MNSSGNLLDQLRYRFGEVHIEPRDTAPSVEYNKKHYSDVKVFRMLLSSPRVKNRLPFLLEDMQLELFFIDTKGRHYAAPITLKPSILKGRWPVTQDLDLKEEDCFSLWDFDSVKGYYADVTWGCLNNDLIEQLCALENELERQVDDILQRQDGEIIEHSHITTLRILDIHFGKEKDLRYLEIHDDLNLQCETGSNSFELHMPDKPDHLYEHYKHIGKYRFKTIKRPLPAENWMISASQKRFKYGSEHHEIPEHPYIEYRETHILTKKIDTSIYHDEINRKEFIKPKDRKDWEKEILYTLEHFCFRNYFNNQNKPYRPYVRAGNNPWSKHTNHYVDPIFPDQDIYPQISSKKGYERNTILAFQNRYSTVHFQIIIHTSSEDIQVIDPADLFMRIHNNPAIESIVKGLQAIFPNDNEVMNYQISKFQGHRSFMYALKKLLLKYQPERGRKESARDNKVWAEDSNLYDFWPYSESGRKWDTIINRLKNEIKDRDNNEIN